MLIKTKEVINNCKTWEDFNAGIKDTTENIIINVPYYHLVFKDDIIIYDRKFYCVTGTDYTVNEDREYFIYLHIYPPNGYIGVSNLDSWMLYKRPWFNWIRFLYTSITKRA